jgi:hypothetical protein
MNGLSYPLIILRSLFYHLQPVHFSDLLPPSVDYKCLSFDLLYKHHCCNKSMSGFGWMTTQTCCVNQPFPTLHLWVIETAITATRHYTTCTAYHHATAYYIGVAFYTDTAPWDCFKMPSEYCSVIPMSSVFQTTNLYLYNGIYIARYAC